MKTENLRLHEIRNYLQYKTLLSTQIIYVCGNWKFEHLWAQTDQMLPSLLPYIKKNHGNFCYSYKTAYEFESFETWESVKLNITFNKQLFCWWTFLNKLETKQKYRHNFCANAKSA